MPAATHEIELKFLCDPADLDRILAAAPAGEDEEKDLVSVYFDTPARDLRKAGASLRVREGGGKRIQTVKRGGGLAREEHEAVLNGEGLDIGLPPLDEILPPERLGALRPAFEVRVRRRQRLVRHAGAEIEIALDEGEIAGADRRHRISELELELKAGAPGALFDLARDLGRTAPLYLSFESKSAQGEALMDGASLAARRSDRTPMKRSATVAEAFQTIARNALGQIAANAQVLREVERPEAVHQLRVAARRLRSALSTFRAVVADDRFDDLKTELKWLAGVAGEARDLDVFIAETYHPALSQDPHRTGLAALGEALVKARAAAHAKVAAAVGSARFRALVLDAAAWTETGAWLDRDGSARDRPARAFAAEALTRRRRKLLKRAHDLKALDDAGRHRVRIEAKKLRYAAEAFAPLFDADDADAFVRPLKALQEHLGALNDAVTAEALATGLDLDPAAAFAAGRLVGERAAGKAALAKAAARALGRLEKLGGFWSR